MEAMTAAASAARASKSALATSSYRASHLSSIGARKTASSRKRANCSNDATNVAIQVNESVIPTACSARIAIHATLIEKWRARLADLTLGNRRLKIGAIHLFRGYALRTQVAPA